MEESVNILFIADEPDKGLWDFFEQSKLDGVDLIISCGDLPPQYLSFLATYFKGPVYYVHGNHDDCYIKTAPEGCISIDGKVKVFKGLRIAGLGGSMRYKAGEFQYTEKQMKRRILKLIPHILFHRGVDIFVTHSPARNLSDGEDLPHMGYQCFHRFFEKFKPSVFAHGHVHMNYSYNQPRITYHNGMTVINAYEKYYYRINKENPTEKNVNPIT